MTRKHRRQTSGPTRRGVFLLGGGLLLAPVSAVAVLRKERPAPQQPPPPAPEAQTVQRPRVASASAVAMAPGWMSGADRKPIEENFGRGGRRGQRGLVLHVQEGEGSLFERFSNPATRSSAHFWVSQAGEIEQYVSVHDRAWTQSEGNAEWVSVETSGFFGKPLTTAQVEAVARVYAWGAREHGWPLEVTDSPKGRGLGTHSMGEGAWGGHACPGAIRAGQRGAVMDRVRESLRT
ncbi:peptidoglycan recognition protein family protein [Streptomyces yaizuensis]|uniref:N-acetylmuramoyl-L-alanine amidase n=1 Tax=Streptomyces yaizuensis TaxID=2989713 RepID=A0ABQ5PAC0_9ACTN|nr:peptidoglycan recognition family protein [Streptomyces sp. YSPA8]GLF99539.1 N-acetylmuramoyl-L-alanine amidase [Streptomyces sp. YSPA8]